MFSGTARISRTRPLLASLSLLLIIAASPLGNASALQQEQQAGATAYSDAYKKCDAAAESTAATVQCISDETARWDARLNAAYRALQKVYGDDDKDMPLPNRTRVALLRDAERAWMTFRDADCQAEGLAASGGGSSERVHRGMCLLGETIRRTQDLEARLKERADEKQ